MGDNAVMCIDYLIFDFLMKPGVFRGGSSLRLTANTDESSAFNGHHLLLRIGPLNKQSSLISLPRDQLVNLSTSRTLSFFEATGV